MKKTFTFGYIIITGIVSIATAIMQIQPALFFLDLFRHSVVLAVLLTWLVLLMPLIIALTLIFYKRNGRNKNVTIETYQTGIIIKRKKQLQSGLIGINIYINNQKNGVVNSGNNKFIEMPPGKITIVAGEGKQASEPIELEIKSGQKIQFNLEIVSNGLLLKNVLTYNDHN